MPFDSVVSIGGQSLLDGVWRILQPALQSLSNPLPISLPGMTNAWVRIRKLTPALSSPPPTLMLAVEIEVLGDLLLTASVKAGTINLALPSGEIKFPTAGQGEFRLPNNNIDIALPGLGPNQPPPPPTPPTITLYPQGTGTMKLPSTPGTLDLSALTGTLTFAAGNLGNVGLPLPSVVPVPLNLTPTNPAQVTISLPLSAVPIDQASAFGLRLTLGTPQVGAITSFPAPAILVDAITSGLKRLLPQLGVPLRVPPSPLPLDWEPFAGVGPTLPEIETVASTIATAALAAIRDVANTALTGLTARTGRLIFPKPATGSPCDVALLPTAARAQIVSTALIANNPILQVGFLRTGVSGTPFNFPAFTPSAAADVEVRIGVRYLRDLLCCLVEKLPNFTFLTPAGSPTNTTTKNCCNWPAVRLELGPLALLGNLELCIVGSPGGSKTIELKGFFTQVNSFFRVLGVSFTLTLNIQLNNLAAITGLRLASAPSVTPDVQLQLSVWALLAVVAAGFSALGLISFFPNPVAVVAIGAGMGALFLGVPILLIEFIKDQLRAVVDTLLSRAHALTSPVAVPPGLFEAFGPLVPASITIDDLIATGVLATPTSPWALLPIEAPKLPTTPPTTTPPTTTPATDPEPHEGEPGSGRRPDPVP